MKSAVLIGAIGVAIAAPVGYYLFHAPHQRQVRLIRAQLAQEQAVRQTEAEVRALLEELAQYRKRLPQEADPSWLVREVVSRAQAAGIQLRTITQQAPQALDRFTRLAVHVEFPASYHQLGTFLDELERSDAFIRITQITVSPPQGEPAASIQLTLETLHLPPPI